MSNFSLSIGGVVGKDKAADATTPKLNVGCLFDHFSGRYTPGKHGEQILNGGFSFINAVVGENNQFKSTLSDYFMLKAQEHYYQATNSFYYETEGSKDVSGLMYRASRCPQIQAEGMEENEKFFFSNMLKMSGNAYWDIRKEYGDAKTDKKNKVPQLTTPFVNVDGSSITMFPPTLEEIDSWSMMSFDAIEQKFGDVEIGHKDNNMMFMNDGRFKTQIMMQMPSLNGRHSMFTFMTAHIGSKVNMDPNAPPSKIMADLAAGKGLKNATEKFTFVPNNMWMVHKRTPLTDSNRIPIYGRGEAGSKDDKDLVKVSCMNLRGKFGQSGAPFDLIFSQTEGLQEHLTLLHYLRDTNKYWGMDSNNTNMSLLIYPEVKFTRNAIRDKIDEDYKLRRALELTAGMCQISNFMWYLGPHVTVSPAEIIAKVKEQGYDIHELLETTRGYWQFEEIKEEKHYLSALDFINIAAGTYKPYWMKKK
ncbi:hypothetical protein TOTORO_02380 [Serratia phage vB_SmaS-Totoro]|nr:hypothetical protein TOTORO_02380 [Serratia phage vB_SmaS-Totoro]